MKLIDKICQHAITYQFHVRISIYHFVILICTGYMAYRLHIYDDHSSVFLFGLLIGLIIFSWVDTLKRYHYPILHLRNYIKDFIDDNNRTQDIDIFYPDMIGEISYLNKLLQAELIHEKEFSENAKKQIHILGSCLDKIHSKIIIVDKFYKIQYINQASVNFFKQFQDNFDLFRQKPTLLKSTGAFRGEEICNIFEQICSSLNKINNLDSDRSLHIDVWTRDFKGLLITTNIYDNKLQRIASLFEIHDLTSLHQARGSLEQLMQILHQNNCSTCSHVDVEKIEKLILSPEFFAISQKIQKVLEIMRKN